MQTLYIQQIKEFFKNKVLNSLGVERDIYQLLADKDVTKAIDLMQDSDEEVDKAISEYNVQTHKVMARPNKSRKNADDYITEKLPRNRAQYINEVELFFLLGRPIVWEKKDGDDEAYEAFRDFLEKYHFDNRMREAKRLAGAETESAKLFRVYRNEKNEVDLNYLVLARSKGYRLRPLFDQYGNMTAFAYGYKLHENGSSVDHWDILTERLIFNCKRGKVGWEVETIPNPLGKIGIIYYQQPKAWDGVVARIEREEMLDSKTADTNNYFADPIASATADVIDNMLDPDRPGKLIQMNGTGSRFEYINPPQSSQTRDAEKRELEKSILFDSFTPDLSFEAMRGWGSISGAAIENSMALAYIKRGNRIEIYGEMVRRELSIIKEILKMMHPTIAPKIDDLKIGFEFAMPFAEDRSVSWGSVNSSYDAGTMSLETAVAKIGACDDIDEEVERIKAEHAQQNLMNEQEPLDTDAFENSEEVDVIQPNSGSAQKNDEETEENE